MAALSALRSRFFARRSSSQKELYSSRAARYSTQKSLSGFETLTRLETKKENTP